MHDFSGDEINTLEINVEDISVEEVTSAIRRLKNGKAAEIDGIQAELLKFGGKDTAVKLQQLCNRIGLWETGSRSIQR